MARRRFGAEGEGPYARPRRLRTLTRLVAPTLTVALLASGCGAIARAYDGTANVLRIGSDGGIDSLNPFVAQLTDAYACFEYMYPYLVQYDAHLQLAPDFASSWSLSPNGRVWTFHTRAGAHWSDGTPLTADDAAWTLTTMLKFQNGATASSAGNIAHMQSAVAPDPDTLVITYSRPVANVLSQLQQLAILPEHVWAKYATGKGSGLKTFSNPAPIVAGGPFELVKYVPKEIALFQRNPEWWGPKPHIEGFGIEYFADDDSMIQALITHQLDAVETVPPTAVAAVKRDGFDVSSAPGLQVNYFSINSNPKMQGHRELLDPVVREALNIAVDRQQIDSVAYLGEAVPAGNVIAEADGLWYDPALKPPAYNVALANHLLDEAGFKKGSNGIREAGGHPMSYQMILYPTGGPETRIFQIMSSDFQKIGVQITAVAEDAAAATISVTGNNNTYPTFQLQFAQWQPEVDPDFQLSVFLKSQWGGWNDSGFDNPQYDKLYLEQGTATNQTARKAIIWAMEKLLYKDLPYVDIDYPEWVEAHDSAWTGFVMTGQGSFNELSDLTLLGVHRT